MMANIDLLTYLTKKSVGLGLGVVQENFKRGGEQAINGVSS